MSLSRLSQLYIDVESLQEEVLETLLALGTSWLLTDEYADLQGRIDAIDFEIDLLEVLNSNSIKN